VPYQPEVPLHTALAQVSTSLNSLIPALATIHTSLTAGKTSLVIIEKELSKINATTVEMSSALGSAQKVIGEYQAVTSQLKDRLEAAQRAVSDWLMTIAWVLSFVLGWLLFAQLGLFTQGYYMLQERSQAKLVQE
jgi:chromosome segregation ATPase